MVFPRYIQKSIPHSVVALLCLLPNVSAAEGWLLPEDEALQIYELSYLSTNDFYNNAGTKQRVGGRFHKTAAKLYSEHGYKDWLTLIASTEVSNSRLLSDLNNEEIDVYSYAFDFGARLPLKKFKNGMLSTRLIYSFPDQHFRNNETSQFRRDGDGEIGLEGGYNFPLYGRNHYVSGSAAYRKRAGSATNQWIFHAVAGLRVHDRLEIMPELDFTTKATGTLRNNNVDVSGLNDFKQAKASLSLLWDVGYEGYKIQLGGTSPFYSRSTGDGYTGKIALWRQF